MLFFSSYFCAFGWYLKLIWEEIPGKNYLLTVLAVSSTFFIIIEYIQIYYILICCDLFATFDFFMASFVVKINWFRGFSGFFSVAVQLGQDYFAYFLKKDLPFAFFKLTVPSKAGKELFLERFLLSDLIFYKFWVEINKNQTNLLTYMYWYVFQFQKVWNKTTYQMS